MMSKYRLIIRLDLEAYDLLTVDIYKFMKEPETRYLGDIVITQADINECSSIDKIEPTLDRDLYGELNNIERDYLIKYTCDMYKSLKSSYPYTEFTGIDNVEIEVKNE